MNAPGWLQLALYVVVLLALAKPLGAYMAAVYEGRALRAQRILGPLERLLYRGAGVDPGREMRWTDYALAMLSFNLLGVLAVYALQRSAGRAAAQPAGLGGGHRRTRRSTPRSSFATNTNWQGYGGETHDELPHADARAHRAELRVGRDRHGGAGRADPRLRAPAGRRASATSGSTSTRTTLYILLPLSLVLALVLVSPGRGADLRAVPHRARWSQPVDYDTPKTGRGRPAAQGRQGQRRSPRRRRRRSRPSPLGPAASQIAIKQLGTNGGGFFNVNSAHPFENPTPLSNFLEMLAILLIPAALCYTFGRMVGDTRQGWALLAAMTIVFVALLALCACGRAAPATRRSRSSASTRPRARTQPGGNMEGKEARFGIANSALWATATTAASNGSVNSMHDSFTPLGGLVPMWLMQLGEVIFGGVGSGLYGMLVFAIIAVFVAGLMIGRTPEYLGKKIEAFEMKMASIAILMPPLVVLVGTALAVLVDAGRAGVANPGAHGFSEILYAFSSAGNNNGSAFAGLSANTPFYNTALASRCCSRATGSRSRCSRSPARWRRRRTCRRRRRARCRRTRRCSSSC